MLVVSSVNVINLINLLINLILLFTKNITLEFTSVNIYIALFLLVLWMSEYLDE